MKAIFRREKQKNNGSALVGVLCVLCIFTAISLSMIFAAYQVLHHSQQIMTKEQCRVLSETFSRELDAELVKANDSAGITKYIKDSMTAAGAGKTWTYYDEKEDGHGRRDVIKTVHAKTDADIRKKSGTLEIGLYWRRLGDSEELENRILTVEVTGTLRGEQYRITNEYRLRPGSESSGSWVWYNIKSAKSGGGTP